MAAKLKFDPELQSFAFSRPLPLGAAYPFDWGFIPSMLGEDGDPLDGMVVHDAALAPGTSSLPAGSSACSRSSRPKTVRSSATTASCSGPRKRRGRAI
jgi:hypothetical protein